MIAAQRPASICALPYPLPPDCMLPTPCSSSLAVGNDSKAAEAQLEAAASAAARGYASQLQLQALLSGRSPWPQSVRQRTEAPTSTAQGVIIQSSDPRDGIGATWLHPSDVSSSAHPAPSNSVGRGAGGDPRQLASWGEYTETRRDSSDALVDGQSSLQRDVSRVDAFPISEAMLPAQHLAGAQRPPSHLLPTVSPHVMSAVGGGAACGPSADELSCQACAKLCSGASSGGAPAALAHPSEPTSGGWADGRGYGGGQRQDMESWIHAADTVRPHNAEVLKTFPP